MKWMNLSTCEHERCLAVVRTDRRLVSQSVHVSVCSWAVTSVIYTSLDDIETIYTLHLSPYNLSYEPMDLEQNWCCAWVVKVTRPCKNVVSDSAPQRIQFNAVNISKLRTENCHWTKWNPAKSNRLIALTRGFVPKWFNKSCCMVSEKTFGVYWQMICFSSL